MVKHSTYLKDSCSMVKLEVILDAFRIQAENVNDLLFLFCGHIISNVFFLCRVRRSKYDQECVVHVFDR